MHRNKAEATDSSGASTVLANLPASASVPSEQPTAVPTTVVTLAPTTALEAQAAQLLFNISGEALFSEGTPANWAFDWIMKQDPQKRDPSDPRFAQRYIMMVFLAAGRSEGYVPIKYENGKMDECEYSFGECRDGFIYRIHASES
mmetsp:Transcript_48515/g.146348  ORF Transcript_48515/g.146348 Transcript_48515/m.146348 type:complete len:145 (-) Transcript_48515:68-502(-)